MKKLLIGLFAIATLTLACPNSEIHELGQLALNRQEVAELVGDIVVVHSQYVYDDARENTGSVSEAYLHLQDVIITLEEYCLNHNLQLCVEKYEVR